MAANNNVIMKTGYGAPYGVYTPSTAPPPFVFPAPAPAANNTAASATSDKINDINARINEIIDEIKSIYETINKNPGAYSSLDIQRIIVDNINAKLLEYDDLVLNYKMHARKLGVENVETDPAIKRDEIIEIIHLLNNIITKKELIAEIDNYSELESTASVSDIPYITHIIDKWDDHISNKIEKLIDVNSRLNTFRKIYERHANAVKQQLEDLLKKLYRKQHAKENANRRIANYIKMRGFTRTRKSKRTRRNNNRKLSK
jgi:hypothetical protein